MAEDHSVFISLMVSEDIPALVKMMPGRDEDYFSKNWDLQNKAERRCFVLRDDNIVAGFVILNENPRYNLYDRLNIPAIQDLFITPAHRNKGLGLHLVEHCEDVALKMGAEQIGISVGLHKTFGSAQRLYIKHGYIPDGFGVTYDRQPLSQGDHVVLDDDLCLMFVKTL